MANMEVIMPWLLHSVLLPGRGRRAVMQKKNASACNMMPGTPIFCAMPCSTLAFPSSEASLPESRR